MQSLYIEYGRVYQIECPSILCPYLFAGMFLQPSRSDPYAASGNKSINYGSVFSSVLVQTIASVVSQSTGQGG